MPERRLHVVSSAVVLVRPGRQADVAAALSALPGTGVHAADGTRLVVTIEGPSRGAVGDVLARMALLDGVIAANLVFEQADESEESIP